MITEIITFAMPNGMTRDEVVANYRRSAPTWRANPDLIRKNDLFDAGTRRAGGVYLWNSMEAVRRARDAAWLDAGPPYLWKRADRAVFRNAPGRRQRTRPDHYRG